MVIFFPYMFDFICFFMEKKDVFIVARWQIICVLFVSICYGCIEHTTPNEKLQLRAHIDTLRIVTERNGLSVSDAPRVTEIAGNEWYVNYNEAFNTLLFYDLGSCRYESTLTFRKEGAATILDCCNYVVDDDRVIVTVNDGFKIFTKEGELLEVLNFEQLFPTLANTYRMAHSGIIVANLLYTAYHADEKLLVIHPQRKMYPWEDEFYEEPLLCLYDIDDRKGEIVPITFPEEFYGDRFYDDLATPHIVVRDSFIVYHFHHSPVLYLYDRQRGGIQQKQFLVENLPKDLSGVKRSEVNGVTNLMLGTKLHNLMYDKFRDRYYMLYNFTVKDKDKKRLLLFDASLNKLGEVDIPAEFSDNYAISEQGLVFRNLEDLAYKYITLYAMHISVEDQK